MSNKWPTISLDIEPEAGRIHFHGGGKSFVDTLRPGEWIDVQIGEYKITFARKRDRKVIRISNRKEKEQS